MIDAIVPAYNEAPTIAEVLGVLRRAGLRVTVVDDGSSDGTAEVARRSGAHQVITQANQGKAGAMRTGLMHTETDPVSFWDADLYGLRPDHVQRLLALSAQGWDMVCGLRDYGALNPLQAIGPLITGERVCRRWVFDAIPADCWQGYAIETAMNHACSRHGGRVVATYLDGLKIRGKVKKTGVLEGLWNHYKMFSLIWRVDGALDEHGTCAEGTCKT